MASADHLKRRLAELKSEKQLHQQVWRDCADLTFPARAHGLDNLITSANDAQQRKAIIYDATPGDACKVGAASVMGAMVPSNALWFGLDIGETSEEEAAYLEEFAKFMWQNIHASNFDAEGMDAMLDIMWAGWFVLYEDEGNDGGYHFELFPVGQCFVTSSRSGSAIDTVYREFEYSVSQCVAEYGIDEVSQKTREAYQNRQFDNKVKLLHAIEPRQLYVVGSRLSQQLPFLSCHIEIDSQHILRESGYHEFPCMVPRWARIPASPYATGPMSDALPDARTLNEVVKWGLMGAETAIAPPMIAEDDGVLNPKNIRMGPRKIIIANSVDSMKPLITGAKVEFAELKQERLQASIRRMLFADQLPPADGPVKTAYEWAVRVEMMRKLAGPMYARFQAEFLQVLVERTFGITWRANEASGWMLVGRPPDSLLGRNFSVRYLSPLARAQRFEDVTAMDRYEQSLLIEAPVVPDVLDVYDFEEASRERSRLLGIPQKLIRDSKKVDARRKARLEAQQAAQEQAMAANGQAEMQGAMAQRMAAA
jgi:head-to-tail connecting protein